MTTNFTALYDACVLYPPSLRDLLIQLAADGMHRAKWSNRIHEEWIRNVRINNPNLTIETLTRIKNLMNTAVPDSLVENYEDIESSLLLPDHNDCHVLAAAIVSHSDVIVTYNLKDFPRSSLDKYGIEAQHPDQFISHLLELNINQALDSVRSIINRLKNPPYTAKMYLAKLADRGLKKSVSILRQHEDFL